MINESPKTSPKTVKAFGMNYKDDKELVLNRWQAVWTQKTNGFP